MTSAAVMVDPPSTAMSAVTDLQRDNSGYDHAHRNLYQKEPEDFNKMGTESHGHDASGSSENYFESRPAPPEPLQATKFSVVVKNASDINLEILMIYFENERVGGGELDKDKCSYNATTGEAVITFVDDQVALRVIHKEHRIRQIKLTVVALTPEPLRVPNKNCLVIYKQPEVDMDDVDLLVKSKWNRAYPGRIIPGFMIEFNKDSSAALVTFSHPVENLVKLVDSISGMFLDGKLSASLVYKTRSILVENLPPSIHPDHLSLLFDSLSCPLTDFELHADDNTAIVHLEAVEYVDTVCDLASRGEVKLKKVPLRCSPYLSQFQAGAQKHFREQVGSTCQPADTREEPAQNYLVYCEKHDPQNEGHIQEIFHGCAKDITGSVEHQYMFVSVHPACKHDHQGAYTRRHDSFLVVPKPPTAVETSIKVTSDWLKFYSKFRNNGQRDIIDPLQNKFGKCVFRKDEGYVVACAPEDAVYIDHCLEETLRRAVYGCYGVPCKTRGRGKEVAQAAAKYRAKALSDKSPEGILIPPSRDKVTQPSSKKKVKAMSKTKVPLTQKLQAHEKCKDEVPTQSRLSSLGIEASPRSVMRLMANDRLLVEIYQADVVKQKTDAIVNPANTLLQHCGGAARAIADAAGPKLVQECSAYLSRCGEVAVSEVIDTTAGDLMPDVKTVLHAVGPVWNEKDQKKCSLQIHETFFNILDHANKLRCSSVSIPAVSAGLFGVPIQVVGEAAFDAIIDFESFKSGNKSPHLKEVHFVNIDDATTSSLKQIFTKKAKMQFDSKKFEFVTMVMLDGDT